MLENFKIRLRNVVKAYGSIINTITSVMVWLSMLWKQT